MKKTFLLVRVQGGGCGYTIGCGITAEEFEADSLAEMVAELTNDAVLGDDEEGLLTEGERELASATVYEISHKHEIDLAKLRALYDRDQRAFAAADAEAKERAELERLQKKYGSKA